MAEVFYFAPKADIFDPVAELLENNTGLKSFFLEKSRTHADARWDWTPTEGTFGGPQTTGDLPRALSDVEFRCEVACRAKTFDEAWLMAQQFGSAIRRLKCASSKIESWTVSESSDQPSTMKSVVILTVVWTAPFLEQSLEEATEKVTIKSIGFDTSSADYGVDDDTLIAPSG